MHAAILGATGSIGKIAAKLLAPQVGRLVLIGRNRETLAELLADLDGADNVAVETDLTKGLEQADKIVARSPPRLAIIQPEHLKPGAVVCDIARPRDVSKRVAEERDDVLVIEGGAWQCQASPTSSSTSASGMVYACMAETMLLALEGHTGDYSLGADLQQEQVGRRRHGAASTASSSAGSGRSSGN